MSEYSHDMNGEKENDVYLEKVGWYVWEVVDIYPETSSKGNEMFVATLALDDGTGRTTVYMVSVKGKRWFLKQFLSACDIQPDENGVYHWSSQDVMYKRLNGRTRNSTEDWIDRNGKNQYTDKTKIIEFKKLSS